MEAAVFMVIPALPVEELSTPFCATAFITRGPTMVFIVPGVFCGSSTQDSTKGALIRRFICGDFIKAFLTKGFTLDSVTTGFTPDSISTSFVRDSITSVSQDSGARGFTMVFVTEDSTAGFIQDFTANVSVLENFSSLLAFHSLNKLFIGKVCGDAKMHTRH